MTRDEIKKIVGVISCTYSNWKPQVSMSFMIDTWFVLLEDMDYKTVSNNLMRYIQSDTSGFAPSIGVLRQGATEYPTELEAWSIVRKAIKNSAYNYNEEFAKLPDAIKRAVGSPSNLHHWSQTDSETLETVEQSHFISVYRSVMAQLKNNSAVRKDLQRYIAIPEAPKQEEPLMIETEKPTVNEQRILDAIEQIKNGTYRMKEDVKHET